MVPQNAPAESGSARPWTTVLSDDGILPCGLSRDFILQGATLIRQYVDEALKMARYDKLDGGTFYGEVPRLRGVMATASTLERCREQLAEVIEEWVLIRVAKRLPIPRLGKARVKVQLVS